MGIWIEFSKENSKLVHGRTSSERKSCGVPTHGHASIAPVCVIHTIHLYKYASAFFRRYTARVTPQARILVGLWICCARSLLFGSHTIIARESETG